MELLGGKKEQDCGYIGQLPSENVMCSSAPSPASPASGYCCKDVWSVHVPHSVIAALSIPIHIMWRRVVSAKYVRKQMLSQF